MTPGKIGTTSLRGLLLAACVTLVAGCASSGGGMATENWTTWTCDNQTRIAWRYVDAQKTIVDARVGDSEVVHHMDRQPEAPGLYFSDGLIAFVQTGDQGTISWVSSNQTIGQACQAR